MNKQQKKVILKGTLITSPEAHLDLEKEVECVLKVRTRFISFVKKRDKEKTRESYTVRTNGFMRDVLFKCAEKGQKISLTGLLLAITKNIYSEKVFNECSCI